MDTDLVAAFDFLCLDWVYMVLEKKGLDRRVISRIQNLYRDNLATEVVNNIKGKSFKNIRKGDLPSMHFFSFGIDPLLGYLEKRLQWIHICSLPVLEERYKVMWYADDVKPSITNIAECSAVDKAMKLFERASGCKIHRNPDNKICKFLTLAKWRSILRPEHIPCPFVKKKKNPFF